MIWLGEGSDNLRQVAKQAIEDENNDLSLSIASLGETTIKISLGKLQLGLSLDRIIETYLLPNRYPLPSTL